MRVLVTGAAGFVGRALVRDLALDHDVVALDRACAGIEDCTIVEGDLTDAATVEEAIGAGCDAVIHLATVPGGATEQDPAVGWRVNVDGSRKLLAALEAKAAKPRFIFASSIAALGELPPEGVSDATPLHPRMLYGAHKAMIEQWVATLVRRGTLQGASLRLPGIVARPPGPSGMQSAFLSDLFHAVSAGEPITLPVSPGATTWLMSLPCVVRNLRNALDAVADAGEPYAFTLPAVNAGIGDLVGEVARQSGQKSSLVSYRPDARIEAGFARFPPLQTPAAHRLGFRDDGGLARLVTATLGMIGKGE